MKTVASEGSEEVTYLNWGLKGEKDLGKGVNGGWSVCVCVCVCVEGENTKLEKEEEDVLGGWTIWDLHEVSQGCITERGVGCSGEDVKRENRKKSTRTR